MDKYSVLLGFCTSISPNCTYNGHWYMPTQYATPLIVNGINAEFVPWHATLYETKQINGPKEFICGATIITENFLVTAAHCVFDENNRRVNDPSKYYVATGNKDRDYDYEQHDLRFVKKARVKNIYVHCNYLGLLGNYAFDIALLEIDVPFVLTNKLIPACIDDTSIKSGIGVVAGFGFTASGSSSLSLQLTKLPYVSDKQCKDINNSATFEQYITSDKFCAGYTNGTSVCDGDSGGGLVFQAEDLWFLRGIVSIGTRLRLEAGNVYCDTRSYSLYTRISHYSSWIRNTIYKIEPTELCIK
ncbi:coagulation factor X-like [Polistes fuscatus]|uniref:coagulation factor X-like n=1 Tax=Polistes fuscatus TaxID=30207 RepID=UPI001CA8E755|nr:coagulation factor X-like [Polistes fuscatus]